MHILVADDDTDNRIAMQLLLEMDGHCVELAANGLEALERATLRVPDAIIMDLGMPVMGGLRATRMLRQRAETTAVPVICVSALLTENEWRERARVAGCVACIAKPADWNVLRALLARSNRLKDEWQADCDARNGAATGGAGAP